MLKSEGVMSMIEVIYKDEKRESKENAETLQIPRNIRQIGLISGNYRIYVEDYVYTFLSRVSEKAQQDNGGLVILFGSTEWADGVAYIFAKGAVMVEGETVAADHITLGNEEWKQIQETGEKYFSELSVVGWFLTVPGLAMRVSELAAKIHLRYFAGGEKILMLMDPMEKEEAFFCYDNGRFLRVSGYYLYYEKNPMMQEYMIEKKWWEVTENTDAAPDEAVRSFRTIIRKKAEKTEDSGERASVFSYVATACLVLAVLATGANFIRNYQKIQSVEEGLEASSVLTVRDEAVSITPTASEMLEEKSQITEKNKETEVQEMAAGSQLALNAGEKEASEVLKAAGLDGEADEKTKGVNTAQETSGIETEIDEVISGSNTGENMSGAEVDMDGKTYEMGSDISAEISGLEVQSDAAEDESVNERQEAASTGAYHTYVIRPGDTLYQISIANYGNLEAIEEICKANDISAEEIIYPGQIIVLP